MPGFYRITCAPPKPTHRSEKHALAATPDCYWLEFLVALVVVAVAHRRLDAVSRLLLGRSFGLGCLD